MLQFGANRSFFKIFTITTFIYFYDPTVMYITKFCSDINKAFAKIQLGGLRDAVSPLPPFPPIGVVGGGAPYENFEHFKVVLA